VVLDGINLHVPEGTIFALAGPQRHRENHDREVLTTLLAPDTGKVVVVGHDVATETKAMRAAIGVTGQFALAERERGGQSSVMTTLPLARPCST
jgi:ABC-2 type transport system ATP-binding protein